MLAEGPLVSLDRQAAGDHLLQRERQGQELQEGQVVGVRLLGTGRQVNTAPAEAAGGIEQVPAVEPELELVAKGAEGVVLPLNKAD